MAQFEPKHQMLVLDLEIMEATMRKTARMSLKEILTVTVHLKCELHLIDFIWLCWRWPFRLLQVLVR